MMSLWDALRMNMMISYQELVRTFHYIGHYLVFPQHQHMHSALDVFKTWLLNELNLGKIR